MRHARRHRWLGALGRYVFVAPDRAPRRLRVAAYRLRNVGLQEWPLTGIVDIAGVGRVACDTVDFIQRYLFLFGVWEPAITDLIRSHLKPGQVFVDVGANIGYYTLLAAQAVGDAGHVIAFEPSKTVRAQLDANIERNGLGARITVHGVAAGAKPGTTNIFLATADNLGQTSTRPAPGFAAEGEVRVMRVDDCVPESERHRVAIMKIDTEGDELAAVRGAQQVIARMPPGSMVLIEVDEPRMTERGAKPSEIFDLMRTLGFQPYAIHNEYAVETYVHHAPAVLEPVNGVIARGDVVFVRE